MATVHLNFDGVAEVLRSAEVAAGVEDYAQQVAANVRAEGRLTSDGPPEVRVDRYTTDRAAAAVTIAHPAGMAIQAKYGTLTRAAGAAGLEVTSE